MRYTTKTCWALTFVQLSIVAVILWQNYTLRVQKMEWRNLAELGLEISTELAEEVENQRLENDALTTMYFTRVCDVDMQQIQ